MFENVVAQYLGVSDPQGSLSRAISSEAIEMANREVENVHAKIILHRSDDRALCYKLDVR